jgi:exopolyphosphatase/guanosine-5'-triphosphate,3'-diphosphate pyrophosphatase
MTQQVKELRLTKSNQGMLLQCVSKHKDLIEYTLLEDVLLKIAKVFKRPFSYQVLTQNTYE